MSHLANPLATAEQLARHRAAAARVDLDRLCGLRHTSAAAASNALPADLLDAVFFATQCLTQSAGLLLDLPQSTTAQANVLLARAWVHAPGFCVEEDEDGDDEDEGHYEDVARAPTDLLPAFYASAAAVYLVAKMGLYPRTVRDVTAVYAFLRSDATTSSSLALADNACAAFHVRLLAWEARLLALLGFDTHVALPHPLAVTYLQALDFFGADAPSDIAGCALAYLNTALLSPQLLYVTHQPHELAVAALYSAARDTRCFLPADRAWWAVFDVDRETLGFLAVALRSVATWADAQQAATPMLWPAVAKDGRRIWTGALTRQQVADAVAHTRS